MNQWREMAAEHTALELLEAEDRIRSLETERDIFRDMTHQLLGALHLMTLRFKRERSRRRKLEGRHS